MEKRIFEKEKEVRIKALKKKRDKVISSYPVGSKEWIKELKKNSK